MPKVLTEAYRICPELKEGVKLIDDLSYTRRYEEVFCDLVDWLVWQHHFPPSDDDPLKKYNPKEQEQFLAIFKIIQNEVKKQTSLWDDSKSKSNKNPNWYDPLGRLYECITSKNKSSRMGQFFTPKHVVNLMAQMNIEQSGNKFERMLDPACGSGRMGLAVAVHAIAKGKPCWVTMNDIDPICTKMTAANMCFNGVVGEALCSNGLDITGKSYRFGYRVEPMMAQVPESMRMTYRLLMLQKTGQDIQKQYVIKPVSYEQTYFKQVNDKVLQELEARKKITNQQERQQAINELKATVQSRMKGTLFDNDTSQADNITEPAQPKKKITPKRKQNDLKKPPPPDNQRTLF